MEWMWAVRENSNDVHDSALNNWTDGIHLLERLCYL